MKRCIACDLPLDHAIVRLEFSGFDKLAMNGLSFTAHARCIALRFPEREIALPDLVRVEPDGSDWHVICAEHGMVALKDEPDDAHLAAAHHMARVHSGIAA